MTEKEAVQLANEHMVNRHEMHCEPISVKAGSGLDQQAYWKVGYSPHSFDSDLLDYAFIDGGAYVLKVYGDETVKRCDIELDSGIAQLDCRP